MRQYQQLPKYKEYQHAYHTTIKSHHRKNERYKQKRMKVLNHYGGKCKICDENRYEFLVIDHINGNGEKHRKEFGGGSYTLDWLIKNNFPDGYRVLCHNHNFPSDHYYKTNTPDTRHYQKLKHLVFEHYGTKCACCGESNPLFLSIDHINGSGRKQMKELNFGRGIKFYRWLIKNNFPSGYRTLCLNCNSAMGHYGYCPHNKEIVMTMQAGGMLG
jgi:predicted restriction endonuclease